ncbi:HhH-GPD-type base excision DNA repair protein [soil metagenome]
MPAAVFPVTGDDQADSLLVADPLALLLGMMLDQQIPMEKAFLGPHLLTQRMGGLDAAAIASADPEDLLAHFIERPALHRFPKSMAERAQALCVALEEHHGGRAADVWEGAADGADLLARLQALPGFGEEKSRIFVAVLAKRFAVRPDGWEAAAGGYADGSRLSVADIDSRDAFDRVRAWKREQKAQARAAG